MKQESAENLLNNYSALGDMEDKQNTGVIVDFVSNANIEVFLQILKENDDMTEAMKVLIAPEIVDLRLMLENKDKELANKDAEIERLKQQLQEMQQQK